ncbi:hypothetical protein FIBSPDRAFT_966615 [Athelia psychrophila]|uniref:Uncharacterized protein n=1 Tax=Athelia psychrophila TaxID=1759441 RepID=A0A167WLR0_9AGAM|nr:hypothetical protein FIBSPDRAFT_966615 [Fibularhizoctonia sp. CBS 109695]
MSSPTRAARDGSRDEIQRYIGCQDRKVWQQTLFLVLSGVGPLIVAWPVEYRVSWVGPDVVSLSQSLSTITQSIQAYVIDVFTLHAASALAAVSALRSFARFDFPLFAPAIYASLGSGRVDTVLTGGF